MPHEKLLEGRLVCRYDPIIPCQWGMAFICLSPCSTPPQGQMNPMAMFTAMLAAAQSLNLKRALDNNPSTAAGEASASGSSSNGSGGAASQREQ
jgi:hypothetical protein